MDDFPTWLYIHFTPKYLNDRTIMLTMDDKKRALAFARAITDGLKIHPSYNEKELDKKFVLYMIYRATYRDKFLRFYSEIIENYPISPESLLDIKIRNLINCVASHSENGNILGAKSFYDTASIIRDHIEDYVEENFEEGEIDWIIF